MKRHLILIAAALFLIPALASANTMTLRAGYYFPKASGGVDSLWTIELSVDTYSKRKGGYYLDYVGIALPEGDFAFPAAEFTGDFNITHGFNVSITPVQFSVKLLPMGRRNKFIPYVGGGVGLYFWSVGIRGEMIDFTDEAVWVEPGFPDVKIFGITQTDAREQSRTTVGYHAFAGLMFPIGDRITLSAEARYHSTKGKFKADSAFKDFEDFDLGGYALTAGLNYWF